MIIDEYSEEYRINQLVNSRPIYSSAFDAEMYAIWGATEYRNEIPDLCLNRAISCWLRNDEIGEHDRRWLLYYTLSPMFAHDKQDDPLNQYFNIMPTENLFIHRLLRNLCIAYNEPPKRDFGDTKINDKYAELIKEAKIDNRLQSIYRISKLCNEVLVRPRIRNLKLELQILTPDMYRIKYDELDNPIEILVPFHEYGVRREVLLKYHHWTLNNYEVLDMNLRPIPFVWEKKTYNSLPNIYKALPYVKLKLNDNEDVYGGNNWEICKAQLFCNKLDYLIDENVTYNMSIWVAINMVSLGESFKMSPGKIVTATSAKMNSEDPIPPSLENISSNPFYDRIQDLKKQRIDNVLRQMGIPTSVLSDQPGNLSGIAMLIDRMELNEVRQEDKSSLISFERELFKMIANVVQTDRKETIGEFDLRIDYADDKDFYDPKDRFTMEQQKFEYGLTRPSVFVNTLSPNDMIITDEDAIKYILQNKEYLKQIRGQDDTIGQAIQQDGGNTATSGGTEQVNGTPTGTEQIQTNGGFQKQGNPGTKNIVGINAKGNNQT